MLAKTKVNSIEVVISNSLIDSYISHDEFVLVSVKRKWGFETRNEKIKDFNSSSKILVYL